MNRTTLCMDDELDEPPPKEKCVPLLDCEPSGRIVTSKTNPFSQSLSKQWNDWRWQMRQRIRTTGQLKELFVRFDSQEEVDRTSDRFPMAITPYYASLMKAADPSDPIFAMAVPQADELCNPPFLLEDPLAEDHDMPVRGLVHRYHDRALIIATTTCAMYCRHCTRKRVAGVRESVLSANQLHKMTSYLHQHPEIRDVIISGGDPFTLSTEALERVMHAVRSVPTVEIIRVGSRVPVTMPMRVTDDLVQMLKRYQPVWVNTHFNHPVELTDEATQACAKLIDSGIPMGNQSVLLRGVNDDPFIIKTLCRELVRRRIRPMYLFQCDLVKGVEHFRTPLSRGIEIMENLRGQLSGLAIPSFVVDAPHGGGKIPVLPTYVVSMGPHHTVLRNFEGQLVSYPEPYAASVTTLPVEGTRSPTVADMVSGRAAQITQTAARQRPRNKRCLQKRAS